MKKYILGVLIFLTSTVFAQNKYLSFTKGYVGATEFNVKKSVKEYSSYIDVTYTFEGAYIDNVKENGVVYQKVTMPNQLLNLVKGSPELPYFTDRLVVNSTDSVTVGVVRSKYKDYSNITVLPSLGDYEIGTNPGKRSKGKVYSKNALYPTYISKLLDTSTFKSVPLANVRINPVRYNPVTKKLRCYSSITYRIRYKSSYGKANSKYSQRGLNMLKSLVENPSSVEKFKKSKSSNALKSTGTTTDNGAERYLIISPTAYKPAVDKLVKWKSMQGYECKVLYERECGYGFWHSTFVKQELKKIYNSSSIPDYILIVGDHYPVLDATNWSYAVEAEQAYYLEITVDKETKPEWLLTDALYGSPEYINSNYDPTTKHTKMFKLEIPVGRISVNNLEEANTQIDKIIKYEQSPTTDEDFYSRGLHCAAYSNYSYGDEKDAVTYKFDHLTSSQTSEALYKSLTDKGLNITRIYTADKKNTTDDLKKSYLTSPYYGNWDAFITDGSETPLITNEINKGYPYILYCGHGIFDHWKNPVIHNTEINQLTNGDKLSVYFGMFTCYTGNFSASKDGSKVDDPCMAEAFMRNPNGGTVAAFANCGPGWVGDIEPLTEGIVNKIYSGENKLMLAKMAYKDYNLKSSLSLQYFGDPAMDMYTDVPTCFDPEITTNGTNVIVNTGVADCKITITSALDPTDASKMKVMDGQNVTFTNINYPYCITIQKYNYIPYIGAGDVYIQNTTINKDMESIGENIYAGTNVCSYLTQGDVNVTSGTVTFKAANRIELTKGFKAEGAKFTAVIEPIECNYSGDVRKEKNLENNNIYKHIESEEIAATDIFTFYPNPSDGQFNVNLGENVATIAVYDILGKKVKELDNQRGNIEIDLTGLKSGVYTATIDTEIYHLNYKLILK